MGFVETIGALIDPIMKVTGALIEEVVGLAQSGNEAAARQKVMRFVAATSAELDEDKQHAVDILANRFPGE